MTAPSSIDPTRFLHEQLAQASPDLLRQMLTTFINTLMSAEADAVCGAGYGERSAERTNSRNGYRIREFDTRAGTLSVAIPKLRAGSYFPDWLLERRRRAERALTTVVATCSRSGRTRQLAAQDHLQGTAPGQPLPLADRRHHRRHPRPAPPRARPDHMITAGDEPLLGMAQWQTGRTV